jgi:ribonuclease D
MLARGLFYVEAFAHFAIPWYNLSRMKERLSLPPPIWVDRSASFRAMVAHLETQPALAVDTESNSLFVYQEQVCLIQISVPGTDYLVDPLALHDLSGLRPLLIAPDVLKVFHGAEYDLSVLHRDFDFTIKNLFDTMWASRILGWPAHGLASLIESHFGVSLNKKYQRANWGLRPLPPQQLDYARLDTHYLLRLQAIQAQELEATQRWPQAQHRFNKLTQVRWESKGFDPDGFWRLPGARDLDATGLGVLCELYLFRDQRARAENRPPFKVLGNKVLVDLSEQRPQNLRALRRIKGISKRVSRRYDHMLLAAIRRGAEHPLDWEERPRSNGGASHKPNNQSSASCQTRFEALRAWRNATAEERGVEPDIVLTNQTLRAVAQRNPRKLSDMSHDALLAPWQIDEFGNALLAVLEKER